MPASNFSEIVDNFEFLDDWEDKYRYVIELGKEMPPLDESLKVAAVKVDGCASQVWIVPKINGTGKTAEFSFVGDSDAMIVRGLIAILSVLYNNLSVDDVLKLNTSKELAKLGLNDHLSAQRSNGLTSMIKRINDVVSVV